MYAGISFVDLQQRTLLSWQYLRNFLEVVTLDHFSDEFADALICNVIVSETDK